MLLTLLYSAATVSATLRNPRHARHRAHVRDTPVDLAARETPVAMTRRDASLIDANAPAGGFQIIGNSGVSAQMAFIGTANTVYFLDKAELNPMNITTNGVTHPAWGTRYDLRTNDVQPMEVASNTFCAAGHAVANGSWVVFGGNQKVTYGGVAVVDAGANPTGANPYMNTDGGNAIRLLDPCDDDSCQWAEGTEALTMASKRWYPTVEALGDGSLIVLGGDVNGGYVSTHVQNNPTYEYWPKQPSGDIPMAFLDYTVPVNLFPLTWLMPSGRLFLQAGYKSILYDMATREEIPLPDMPYAVRVYPASAATVMLPLTPANGYTPEILFCGGSAASYEKSSDGGAGYNVTAVPADNTCVRIKPDDANPTYVDDDHLPEPRSMGQLIYLPDGTLWLGNGVGMGTAGYGDEKWSVGQSYGQDPIYMPAIYDPNAPAGKRFNRDGLSPSPEERMYHSTAILLADGAILVSGSNPNKDFTTEQWPTKYSVEKFYPRWYNEPRPVPSRLPSTLSYGGNFWNLTLTNKLVDPTTIKVVVIRTGFSTHAINMGQRYLELETSYEMDTHTGLITVFASQMPPNANVFTPGPAMIFLVVDGVPSVGEMIMVGSGAIEVQPILAASTLPAPRVFSSKTSTSAEPLSTPKVKSKTGSVPDSAAPVAPLTGNQAAVVNQTSSAMSLVSPALSVTLAIMSAIAWM